MEDQRSNLTDWTQPSPEHLVSTAIEEEKETVTVVKIVSESKKKRYVHTLNCSNSLNFIRNCDLDQRLIDLSSIIQQELPRMGLSHIQAKMRDPKWTSFVLVESGTGRVIGGSVCREHKYEGCETGICELFLLSIKSDCQQKGLGRLMITNLKK